MILATHGILNSSKSQSDYDSDAAAFFTSTGITNTTQKDAVNTLVLELKAESLWTKFIAIYPLVGGSATTHKYNLKNPADTDAAFRLVFSGGVTHDANGITGNGTNGYANTFIIPITHLSLNDNSLFVYVRTNSSGAMVDIGALNSIAPQYRSQMNPRNASNLFVTASSNNTLSTSTSNSDSRGFFGISRISSTEYKQTKNTTQTTINDASTTQSSAAIAIMALGGTASPFYAAPSSRNLAFACIGSGLTDTEADTLYTIVQDYQTALSRNV
jgi:hypothetical protein